MEVTYEPRGSGWAVRGRPRKPADPVLVDILRATLGSGSQAKVPLDGASDHEIRATITELSRAAAALGKDIVLRHQKNGGYLRFYAADKDEL